MNFESLKKEKCKYINSREAQIYIDRKYCYKIFKNQMQALQRKEIIDQFLSEKIENFPRVYDYIYKQGQMIGYQMKSYPKSHSIMQEKRYQERQRYCEKLVELINHLNYDHHLCYLDFHSRNIFAYHHNLLLFDLDSCVKTSLEAQKLEIRLLQKFIISVLIQTSFYEYEVYYTQQEREEIRSLLFPISLESNEDLIEYIRKIKEKDTKRLLKKIRQV